MASLLIQPHRFRRPSFGRDMFFGFVLVAGWVTIGVYHGAIFDKLREIVRKVTDHDDKQRRPE